MKTEDDMRVLIVNALVDIKALTADAAKALMKNKTQNLELASLGIDSMAVINFCNALEEGLGREIEIEELVEHATLNSLAKHFANA